MVPYVRKSFWKHFKDGLKYCEDLTEGYILSEFYQNVSIEDEFYKTYKFAYEYAMDMTEREVHQAVEGMYHNLKY